MNLSRIRFIQTLRSCGNTKKTSNQENIKKTKTHTNPGKGKKEKQKKSSPAPTCTEDKNMTNSSLYPSEHLTSASKYNFLGQEIIVDHKIHVPKFKHQNKQS